MFKKNKRINYFDLKEFSRKIMEKIGCNTKEAKIISEILVEADLRGIHSHGIARLKRYVDHIKDGIIEPNKEPITIFETTNSLIVDGNNGVGQYVSNVVTEKIIQKTQKSGICIATVRNSNHYGIAGYYAEKIAKNNMLGISLTNTAPLVVPTYGKNMLLGTNPIAFAFPLKNNELLLVDMATSVVPRGKLEVYSRVNKEIPLGWATNELGIATTDPNIVLNNMKKKKGGGLLPLGGEGEKFSGHKGYGLGLMIEILTAGLSLGSFSYETYEKKGKISHFFMAIDISIFGNTEKIKDHVINLINVLKNSEKASGQKRIYIHGEKEFEKRKINITEGILLDEKTIDMLNELEKLL